MFTLKMPKEDRERVVDSIVAFFMEERGEEIGSVAAERVLDAVTREIGPYIHNQAVQAARKVVGERMLALEDELYALEQPTSWKSRG